MKDNPLVSVIIPIYNVEEYLQRCIDSIIKQTYKNLEIILVDDGSTDNCPDICDDFRRTDSRIMVIHKSNGGLSDARNAGMAVAKGAFYLFVDSDDYIMESAIENMLTACLDNNCDISVCNMIRFFDDGTTEPFYKPTNDIVVYRGIDKYLTLNQPSACNKLFRSKLFKKVEFPKGKYFEDTFIYHEVLYNANDIVLTGTDDYWYFLRRNSILGEQKYTEKYFDFIEAVYYRAYFLKNKDIQPFAKEAFLSLYAALYNIQKAVPVTLDNKDKYIIAYNQFNEIYKMNISDMNNRFSFKQRIRFWLLSHFPNIHKTIY